MGIIEWNSTPEQGVGENNAAQGICFGFFALFKR
jgi:hypothetical protein